jgi:hypothetical protein
MGAIQIDREVPATLVGGYGCAVVTEREGSGGVVRVQPNSTIKGVLADIREVRKKCSRKYPRQCDPGCPIRRLRYDLRHVEAPAEPVDN